MELFPALGPAIVAACASQQAEVTKYLFVSATAASDLSAALAREVQGRVAVVADARTAVFADPCVAALRSEGFAVHLQVLPDAHGHCPICDEETKAALQGALPQLDALVGVGSGVISDLVKWVAFERNIPAAIFATAASMNGYSAANVAPSIAGVKTLVSARSHRIIAADPEVLAAAPRALTTAGLGDVIAKWVSTADWRMNQVLFGEAYSDPIAGIIDHVESTYLAHPEALAAGQAEAISALFSALVFSGCAMTLQGSSMPASGGEHLISHALDMRASAFGESHDLHGRQVGLGTITAAALFERVLGQEVPDFQPIVLRLDRAGWGSVADAVAAHHEKQTRRLAQAVEQLRSGDTWARLRPVLREMVPSPGHVKSVLMRAGAAHRVQDIGVDRERFRWAVLNGAQMRERFTSLDLAWAAGVLPGAIDEIMVQYL